MIATRDEFLDDTSHDLHGLLGGLAINADILLKCVPDGTSEQSGPVIRKCADANRRLVVRLSRLVNDLLDVTRIQAGKLSIVLEQVDVPSLVTETVEAFSRWGPPKQVTVVTKLPQAPVHMNSTEGTNPSGAREPSQQRD